MGKTTLLDDAVESAAGMRVARISGIEAETNFGFAALQRLFIPFMDRFDRLPGGQRDALGSAFGLVAGPPADRFLVGLAVLTLLAEVARDRPLVCVVDDAQWLDRESLDALAFLGRRLYADRIALLFAVRTSPETHVPLEGLPVLPVEGLPEDIAIELLGSVVDGSVDPEVARRIVAETEGCPLAVTELARELSPEQLTGVGFLPDPLPISGRLETHFLAQVRRLPEATQLLMLVAATESTGDPAVLWRAARLLEVAPEAAEPAEATGLITLQARVEFRHPLIRSAIYGGASPPDRRRVHAALAEATNPELDPDGRAWHLAAAALGPDEDVAAELERGALRARSRGRYASDAALLARSAELTPDATVRARRLLTAAQLHQVAGAPVIARALLEEATPALRHPLLRAQARRLDAALNSYTMPGEIPSVLLSAAQALEALDARLARDTYAEALEAAMVSGQLTKHTTLSEIGRAALGSPPSPDPDPTIADLMIDAFATRLATGYAEAVPHLRRVVDTLCADDTPYAGFARWSALGADAGTELWDADGYRTTLLRLEQNERERGALDSLRITLGGLGHSEMWSGRFAAAEARHSEATDIAVALGADAFVWEMLKVELFAWQGRDTETRSIVDVLTTGRGLGRCRRRGQPCARRAHDPRAGPGWIPSGARRRLAALRE